MNHIKLASSPTPCFTPVMRETISLPSVLEVSHIDGNHSHNWINNLAILCLTCHRMLDLGIIPKTMVRKMRKKRKTGNWDTLRKTGKKRKRKRK